MKNIIETIEAKLQEQKDAIFVKDILIKNLREQLEKANAEIEALKAGATEGGGENGSI